MYMKFTRRIGFFIFKSLRFKILLRVLAVLTFLIIVDLSGVHLQLFFEKDFYKEFEYPLESPDFAEVVKKFRFQEPEYQSPINKIYSEIPLITAANEDCYNHEEYQFLLLVKSAPNNFKNRQAIRKTWKQIPNDISTKLVFFMGKSSLENGAQLQDEESDTYQDVVKIDYIDSYYNNTLKTMVEMKWAAEYCSNFNYALLVDDDYFVSVKNLFQFTQVYLKHEKLYAGFTMFSKPLRHKFFNKWYITLKEYPYNRWPKYVTAGAILLSKPALLDIYYASFFVKHFRFDDIYVALCAKKMQIEPIHSEQFRFWEQSGESPEKDLIVAHGYRNPERLEIFWKVQKEFGFV